MGVCASAPATLPAPPGAGPAVWAPPPSRTVTSDGEAHAASAPAAPSSSSAALAAWAAPATGQAPRAVDPAAPLTLAVRAPPPRPAAATTAAAPAAATPCKEAPTTARPSAPAPRPPPPPPALGALDEDEDTAPGALTPGRAHDRPTGPPPTMLQAPVDALPPAAGLAYAAPYIPPPGPPRPPSPGPRTPADAAAAAADAGWRPARRRAVLVACSYRSEGDAPAPAPASTSGSDPIGDAAAVRTLLATKFGFGPGETVFLSDAQPHARLRPTKANILAAAAWLVGGAGPADSLVFAFFGRGAGPGGAPVGWVDGGAGAVAAPPLPPAPPTEGGRSTDDDAENEPPSTGVATPDAVTACSSPVKGSSVLGGGEAAAGDGAAEASAAATAAAAAAAASLAAFFGRTAAAQPAPAPLSPARTNGASVLSTPPATPPPAPGVASPTIAPRGGAPAPPPAVPTSLSLASAASLTASAAGPLAACTSAPPAASSGAAGVGYCPSLAPSDWRAGRTLTPGDLHAALVAALPKGARLLAAIDAAGGRFSLGLPAAAAVRPDGWPAWAAAGSRAVGPPAPGAGEAVLIAGDYESDASTAATAAQGGAIAYALVQACEQGHTGSWAALVRALRYATRNGGPGFGPGTRPPAVTASRRFDFNRPFLL